MESKNQILSEAFGALFESTLDMRYKLELSLCDKEREAQLYELLALIGGKIGQYNSFNTKRLMSIIHGVDRAAGRAFLNENNPNNGRPLFDVEIGREASVVCYITVNLKYSNTGRAEFEKTMRGLARTAKADEFSVTDEYNGPYSNTVTYRIWWD